MKIQEEFARELIPGETYYFNYKNKTVSGKFKRATKAWKIFEDDNGNEMLINSWSNVATTPEDIEGVERAVDKMEKDAKLPSRVPNRFTKAPNRHGFVESSYKSGDRYYGGLPSDSDYKGPGKNATYYKELVKYFRDTAEEYTEYKVIGSSPITVVLRTPDGKETIDLRKFDSCPSSEEAIEMASHYFDDSLFEANELEERVKKYNKLIGESNIDRHGDRLVKIVNNIATKIINDGWYKDYDDEPTLYNEVVDFVQDLLYSDNQDNYISNNDYEFIKDETDVAGIRNKNAYGGGKYEFDTDFCDSVANKVLELSRIKNEANVLEKRAKKHKKKQKGLPMNGLNPNAGNVEINNKVFNAMNNVTNSPSTNPTGPMGEEMTKLEAMTCLNRLNEEDSNERDFAIYCNNAFGKYKVANWKATDAETAVAEFKELNPKYTKTGLITAVEI